MFGAPKVSSWILEDVFTSQNYNQTPLQEFQQPINKILFESNNSSVSRRESLNEENSSPLKIQLAQIDILNYYCIRKSISMMGDDIQPSPLTPFLPNQLQRFNSEVFVNFELTRNQSNILGENKYIEQQGQNMVIESQDQNYALKKQRLMKKQKQISSHQDFGLNTLYEVIKFIGKGKLGKVYKVRSKIDGLYYAVKKINLNELDPINQQILHQNIQSLAQIQVNSMVRIYDFQLESNFLYIIMEHCEFSLKIMQQKRQRFFESDIRRILLDISQNLLDLENNPSHQNINPGNILYSKSQKYKLSDYMMCNVQCMINSWDIDRKYQDQSMNKLDKGLDKINDVYSLGVIALELMLEKELSKGIKFIGFNVLHKLDNLFHYSTSLKQLVKRMVSSFPEQRPSLKEIIKQTKVNTEEELQMLKKENENLQIQVDELQPNDRNRNKSV